MGVVGFWTPDPLLNVKLLVEFSLFWVDVGKFKKPQPSIFLLPLIFLTCVDHQNGQNFNRKLTIRSGSGR